MMTFYGPSFETKVAAGLGRTRRSRAPYSGYPEYGTEGVKARVKARATSYVHGICRSHLSLTLTTKLHHTRSEGDCIVLYNVYAV